MIQDFAPTNNEYLTSTETIRASSSPSAEKEPVLTLKNPEFHPDNKIPDEEQISATTVLSQVDTHLSSINPPLSIYGRFLMME
jgi:hypothetical protein